mmetsp:Transcript_4317/g.12441  ORF Transcript_4317/g.12441 Transcript_4317/m.12441 type:complete len:391 (-) Transcript_4317:191-1363(-)
MPPLFLAALGIRAAIWCNCCVCRRSRSCFCGGPFFGRRSARGWVAQCRPRQASGWGGRGLRPEVSMLQGVCGSDATRWVKCHHAGQQVQRILAYLRENLLQGHRRRRGKLQELRQVDGAGPGLGGGRPQRPKYLAQLVYVRLRREPGPSQEQLCKNAASSPDVHGRGVQSATEQKLRGPVPACKHLIGVLAVRAAENPRQTEVGKFQFSSGRHKEVVGLHIAVQHPPLVAESQTLQNHLHVRFHIRCREDEGAVLDDQLQVRFAVLKHQLQVALLVLEAIQKLHQMRAAQLLQQLDFPQGCYIDALCCVLKIDLFNSNDLPCLLVGGLDDCTKGSFPEKFSLCVLVHGVCILAVLLAPCTLLLTHRQDQTLVAHARVNLATDVIWIRGAT